MTGVYVHIPYCVKKCAYCDFCSVPRDLTAEAYPGRTAILGGVLAEECGALMTEFFQKKR